jgi:nitrogen regulatory protein PII-like uncharacterized protein
MTEDKAMSSDRIKGFIEDEAPSTISNNTYGKKSVVRARMQMEKKIKKLENAIHGRSGT